MKPRLIALGALLVVFWGAGAAAQTQVHNYYEVTSSTGAKGMQGVDPLHGLPIGALAVASCGGRTLTAGISYSLAQDLTGTFCIGGSVSITFPTIGAAAPATGVYNAINVAGTLRGWSGLSTGSIFPGAVAIVDASGNQITTFGGAATTSNASSGVATSSTNQAAVAFNYVWNGATWDQASGLSTGTLGVPSAAYVSVQGAASGGGFPTAATAISGNATGTTGAVVGTLAGVSAKTTYICGFSISATGGVATLGPIVIAGIVTASQTYQLFSTATGANLSVPFSPCIPASATNTAITITTTADATASAVDVNSWGYQQ